MSALSAARLTPRQGEETIPQLLSLKVAASKKIYAGALVALNGGYAEPGATATGLVAAGRAEETADNSSGSAGDISVNVRRGIFRWDNSSSTDEIKQADVGSDCYIVDDHTVAKTDDSSARSKAGKVWAVDDDGVWVETY